MTSETQLARTYDPKQVEPRINEKWQAHHAFHADPADTTERGRTPYSIVIPPPNVTAALHLGHALNNTLQDILVRFHRMCGENTMWMPGTDHAGIATQTVVEKRVLQEEGNRRVDFERDQFVRKIQAWKDEYEQFITNQLKQMGCSCDFERQRFTMDEVCARAVREAFFRLFRDGLIYRGKRLVNWDPFTQTALADDEVEMHEVHGHFWYMKYPIVEGRDGAKPQASGERREPAAADYEETGDYATVATTRPETMLGDTAVAVNPDDPERKHLIGKHVRLPIVDRLIPIIGDEHVTPPDPESDDPMARYASGFLKVTPAHDPNDYEIGERHRETIENIAPAVLINVMAPDASISLDHGWREIEPAIEQNSSLQPLLGLSREEARYAIVQWFKQHDLLGDTLDYTHTVGHSYRSHVPVEPYLSDQWYVQVTDDRLAGAALRAMAPDQRASGGTGVSPAQSDVENKSGTGVSPAESDVKNKSGAGVSPAASDVKNKSGAGVSPAASRQRLERTRRRLPHWRLQNSAYFVTFRLANGTLDESERQLVLDACFHWDGQRADVMIVCVMPDHVHMILQPKGSHELSTILHSIKSFTAHDLDKRRGVRGEVWQDESYDRIIRHQAAFEEKWEYIRTNPVRAKLVDSPEAYPFTAVGGEGRRDACPTVASNPTELRFTPPRYAKTFQQWHENIRDWCISRQLWWGHRIPVWSYELSSEGKKALFQGDKEMPPADAQAITAFNDLPKKYPVGAVTHPEPLRSGGSLGYDSKATELDDAEGNVTVSVPPNPAEGILRVCAIQPEVATELERLGYEQDPDVLDTWFSSALWPMSTMGWPEPDDFPEQIPEGRQVLDAWNPTNALCTAREIITLWVSRMVMFNVYFRGCLPFHDVFVHAMIQDGHGQKMSKSLGNGVDPMDIIHTHGSDAMRFTLASMTTHTQDVRLPVDIICPHTGQQFDPKTITTPQGYKVAAPVQESPDGSGRRMVSSYGVNSGQAQPTDDMPVARNSSEKFDIGRRFSNKLWNAARFALSNFETPEAPPPETPESEAKDEPTIRFGEDELDLADRWILSRLTRTVQRADEALANYAFSDYAQVLYDFVWRDLCDWYIELVKPVMRTDPKRRRMIATLLDASLRLLHPVMPFITERLWEALNETAPQRGIEGIDAPGSDLLIQAAWPVVDTGLVDEEAERTFAHLQQVISGIREVRTTHKVPPRQTVDVSANAPAAISQRLLQYRNLIATLTNMGGGEVGPNVDRPGDAASTVIGEVEIYVHGVIDAETERNRLDKRQKELAKQIETLRGRLNNENYVNKAPAHLVQETRDNLASAEREQASIEQQLSTLQTG